MVKKQALNSAEITKNDNGIGWNLIILKIIYAKFGITKQFHESEISHATALGHLHVQDQYFLLVILN